MAWRQSTYEALESIECNGSLARQFLSACEDADAENRRLEEGLRGQAMIAEPAPLRFRAGDHVRSLAAAVLVLRNLFGPLVAISDAIAKAREQHA